MSKKTKKKNCWTVDYSFPFKVFIYKVFCLWFVFIHFSSSHLRKHSRLASRACVYAFSFSLGVCVCQSDHYSRWQITGEQRSLAAPRLCEATASLRLCPCDRPGSLWWDKADKETRLSVWHQRTRAKKVWFGFFPWFEVSLWAEWKTHSILFPIIKLQSVRAEHVSVLTTESTKSVWTDHLRLSLWSQMEIWWKMWTVKQALVKRACRSSRESWERLRIVFLAQTRALWDD